MDYQGKPLTKLTRGELIELAEKLAAELRMVGSTVPSDIKIDDAADLLPPDEEPWNPPKISGMLYKGVGKPGGK